MDNLLSIKDKLAASSSKRKKKKACKVKFIKIFTREFEYGKSKNKKDNTKKPFVKCSGGATINFANVWWLKQKK